MSDAVRIEGAPTPGLVHWATHTGLMIAAMIPCLTGTGDVAVLAACTLMMAALGAASASRARRDPRCLPEFVDNLAMLALLFAMLLAGHGTGGHHGSTSGGALSIGEGLALATTLVWAVVRAAHVQRLRTALPLASFAVAAAMVSSMLASLLLH